MPRSRSWSAAGSNVRVLDRRTERDVTGLALARILSLEDGGERRAEGERAEALFGLLRAASGEAPPAVERGGRRAPPEAAARVVEELLSHGQRGAFVARGWLAGQLAALGRLEERARDARRGGGGRGRDAHRGEGTARADRAPPRHGRRTAARGGGRVKIHEYQAKQLLRGFGVAVPRGHLALTPVEAEGAFRRARRRHRRREGADPRRRPRQGRRREARPLAGGGEPARRRP